MGSSTVTLVAFGSISMVATAAGLLLKDLLFGVRQSRARRSLRRSQTVYDRPRARTMIGRFDQGFDRLILESGLEIAPLTGFLIVFSAGLIAGGSVTVYSNLPMYGCLAAVMGMVLPLLYFSIIRRQRMIAVRSELPNVIDMIARATRAGQSLEQAVDLTASESKGIMGRELRKVMQQLNMGASFERAMQAMSNRMPVVELRILVTTLVVQRQSGGHLSETLERMSSVVRDRLAAQRQIRATTSAGRISAFIIAGLAPIAFIAIMMLNPGHIRILFEDPLGKTLFIAGCALEVIGLLWVVMLMRSED